MLNFLGVLFYIKAISKGSIAIVYTLSALYPCLDASLSSNCGGVGCFPQKIDPKTNDWYWFYPSCAAVAVGHAARTPIALIAT